MKPQRLGGNALYAPPGCCQLRGDLPPETFVLGAVGLGVVAIFTAYAIMGARRR